MKLRRVDLALRTRSMVRKFLGLFGLDSGEGVADPLVDGHGWDRWSAGSAFG